MNAFILVATFIMVPAFTLGMMLDGFQWPRRLLNRLENAETFGLVVFGGIWFAITTFHVVALAAQ